MSKYDVEVEARLQALESTVASLQAAWPKIVPGTSAVSGDVEAAGKHWYVQMIRPTADDLDQ